MEAEYSLFWVQAVTDLSQNKILLLTNPCKIRRCVAVLGDLFESEEDINDGRIWRDVSENVNVQLESRKAAIQLADYIIPGHGPMFKVTPELRYRVVNDVL